MPSFLARLKSLDAFPKVNEDFFKKTFSGGVITLVSSVLMAVLFVSELRLYLTPKLGHSLAVDTTRSETISINFDITFPRMPCSWMSLDAMDISGELQLGVDHEIYRRRLDPTGDALDNEEQHDITLGKSPRERELKEEYCGSCYGAEERDGQCCNTCTEVHDAYRKKGWAVKAASGVEQCESEGEEHRLREQQGEGCALWGSLSVNKVAGNFHFAPGRSYQRGSVHVHDLVPFQDKDIDFSHHIVSLSFGTVYPGMVNPLDGVAVQQANRDNAQGQPGMFQYFLKVVPTAYTDASNRTIRTNQISVTEHFQTSGLSPEPKLPGVFFFYDLSPIKVEIREYKDSFLHFLTNVCAIVGGIFTVAGLLDGMVYFGHNALKKKVELGKLS